MTKSLLISIQPKHLVNILNGKKTLELRKSVPKDYVGWVYIYCTKGKPYYEPRIDGVTKQKVWNIHNDFIYHTDLNGKVVARFWFDEYDIYYFNNYQNDYRLINKSRERLMDATIPYKKLCLTIVSIYDYGKGKILYTWHIKKLEIFDTPLSLNDFYNPNLWMTYEQIKEYEKETNDFIGCRIKKAPQRWRYVYRKDE